VQFPKPLTFSITPFDGSKTQTEVYPNLDNQYFYMPFYFSLSSDKRAPNPQNPNVTVPYVNVEMLSFFGIAVSGRILNGVWIDFVVAQMMWFLLNGFNLWLIVKPIKIV
jgi:hypothetical protein